VKSITISKASQTITFVAPSGATYGTADFDPAATASSGLAVSYTSSTTSVCTIVAGKVHTVTAGSCTVTASQAGNNNYLAAAPVSRTFEIARREGAVAYIGQTVFQTSGSSSTTAQVTLSASVVQDPDGLGSVANATVTFKDLLTNTVLASNVKVSPVSNSSTGTGTANTVVTLSTGQYGAQEYLLEVTLGGSYRNDQQLPPVAAPLSPPYEAAHPQVTVMIPPTPYSTQGTSVLSKLSSAAGTYGDSSAVSYAVGLKYNNSGTNPQGQIQLVLRRSDGMYYVKSNSITSVAFTGGTPTTPAKDVTLYTKASIYKVSSSGALTSIDGGVTLRLDAHEGCTTSSTGCAASSGDSVGFTVLSGKTSALYYSNNWVYDSVTRSWRTMPQSVGSATGVVIN
jgi:hypothetical protein